MEVAGGNRGAALLCVRAGSCGCMVTRRCVLRLYTRINGYERCLRRTRSIHNPQRIGVVDRARISAARGEWRESKCTSNSQHIGWGYTKTKCGDSSHYILHVGRQNTPASGRGP